MEHIYTLHVNVRTRSAYRHKGELHDKAGAKRKHFARFLCLEEGDTGYAAQAGRGRTFELCRVVQLGRHFWRLCCAGFKGHFTNKAGKTREGCATFFRRSRLQLVRRQDVRLKELFEPLLAAGGSDGGDSGAGDGAPPDQARHARFAPMLRASPALAAALQKARSIDLIFTQGDQALPCR